MLIDCILYQSDVLSSLRSASKAFTLAELLIALVILGEIAAFTIPKILTSQQNGKYKAAGKEVAGNIAEAYNQLKIETGVSSATKPADLMPYMNYVALQTTGTVDHVPNWPGFNTWSCAATLPCYKLHNGGTLYFDGTGGGGMGGTSTTHAMRILFDPDGVVTDGTTNGPGKAIGFFIFYNGRITSYGQSPYASANSGGVFTPLSVYDPPWFSW